MRIEITKLDREQRNRLLGRETPRDPDAEYVCDVGIRSQNGKEYYEEIYDSEGKRVGGNLSIRKGREKKDDVGGVLGGN